MSPIVIDDTDPNTVEQFVLDGLAINDGLVWAIQFEGIDMTPPPMRPEWIGAADSEFQDLVRAPLHENRKIVIPLQGIQGATKNTALDRIGALQDKLTKAAQTRGGIPLTWTPRSSGRTVTFDVLAGEITGLPLDWLFSFKSFPKPTVTLTCKPYWRGVEVDAGTATSSTPFVTKEIVNAAGDIRALGRVVVTDTATQPRRNVEWGLEGPLTYNPATSLMIDSDNMITAGYAGVQTTQAGSYDPNATGNNTITSNVTTAPQAICGTGTQPHVGTFRVKLRTYNTLWSAGLYVRLAWRAGDGAYVRNDPVFIDWGSRFGEVDLGPITIPPALLGTQSWDGVLESWSVDVDDIQIDYLVLVPVESGYGKARAAYSYSPGVITARDSFTGTTAGGALNARSADLGGTWATSGTATDFTFYDSGAIEGVQRATGTDTGAGRFALLGTSVYTNTEVNATVSSAPIGAYAGLVLRYVDATHYVTVTARRTSLGAGLFEVTKVDGTATVIGQATLNGLSFGFGGTIRVIVFASGRLIATATQFSSAGATVEAYDSTLATGGSLASGKTGLFDYQPSSSAAARQYDDFQVATPATEPIVLYSGRSLQVRHDDTLRESSAGGTWGKPQSYRGSRFLVPVGTSRLLVKARRNDIETAADEPVTDATQVQVFLTPRGLVVPR